MTGPPEHNASQDQLDPVFVHTRREAIVILIVWAIALVWSVGYCTLFGYPDSDTQVSLTLGMPSWVFFGVLSPWMGAGLFSVVFSLFFMADDDLGLDEATDGPEHASDQAEEKASSTSDKEADDD